MFEVGRIGKCGVLVMIVAFGVIISSCVGPVKVRTEESQEQILSTEANRATLKEMSRGIVAVMQITDRDVNLTDAQVRLVPMTVRKPKPGIISVEGMRGKKTIVAVGVSDPRVVIAENNGTIQKDERSIYVALPLDRPIDRLVVQTDPEAKPVIIDVREVFSDYCKRRIEEDFCK